MQKKKGKSAKGEDEATQQSFMANPGDGSESDNDFKVVLAVRGGIAMVGVHQPARDAHIESFAYSSLEEMLPEVQGVVERASETWGVEAASPGLRQARIEEFTATAAVRAEETGGRGRFGSGQVVLKLTTPDR